MITAAGGQFAELRGFVVSAEEVRSLHDQARNGATTAKAWQGVLCSDLVASRLLAAAALAELPCNAICSKAWLVRKPVLSIFSSAYGMADQRPAEANGMQVCLDALWSCRVLMATTAFDG
jgi:hypothetical protein